MHNQDQVPTIAELWKEADYLIELTIPHLEGLTNPNNRVNEERRPYYISQLAKCKEKLESLRQQLLERCRKVQAEGLEREYTTFGIDGFIISEQSFEGVRIDNTNSAKEMGCAYLFWAWELEQREKEASGD